MIARPHLPASFATFNGVTGAPYSGPYGQYVYAPSTRVWEYAWAFHAVSLQPGMRALDVGGGLSGFAITLAQAGLDVVVVDPKPLAPLIGAWAREWGVHVEAHATTVPEAGLEPNSFDVAFCLSVIEHVPDVEERRALMRGVYDLLRPGAPFVVTLDICLGMEPFTNRPGQPVMRNVSVAELIRHAPYQLAIGQADELTGMPGFDPGRISSRARRGEFLRSGEILSQCFVLTAGPPLP